MLQEHIQIVEKTFSLLQQNPHKFMTSYYANLFEMAPHLRKLFPLDLRALQHEVNAALNRIAQDLDNEQTITDELAKLALQHQQFGLKNSHCLLVLDALMHTLNQQLGDAFTFEAREAWATLCFNILNLTAHPCQAGEAKAEPNGKAASQPRAAKSKSAAPSSVSRAA